MRSDSLEITTQLDILGIVVSLFPSLVEDHAVDKCKIHISFEGDSYLELSMYDLQDINSSNAFYGDAVTKKKRLTQEEANELYSHIKNMTELPDMIRTFHTELSGDDRTYAAFNIEYFPTKRINKV